jgi:hypothetical protein
MSEKHPAPWTGERLGKRSRYAATFAVVAADGSTVCLVTVEPPSAGRDVIARICRAVNAQSTRADV